MPIDNSLAADRDMYRRTVNELADLSQNLEAFSEKFKRLAQTSGDDQDNSGQTHSEAQQTYRDLATLLELSTRIARP